MPACGYEFYLRVLKLDISRVSAANEWDVDLNREYKIRIQKRACNIVYYIDTDEIPGFFLLLKNHIFIAHSEDTIFIFRMLGYWCRHGY